jgi:hypothetical protein
VPECSVCERPHGWNVMALTKEKPNKKALLGTGRHPAEDGGGREEDVHLRKQVLACARSSHRNHARGAHIAWACCLSAHAWLRMSGDADPRAWGYGWDLSSCPAQAYHPCVTICHGVS